MLIRFEEPEDIDQIRKVNLSAFDTEIEAKLVDELRASRLELISLVAVDNDDIVGHILFSPVKLNGKNNSFKIMGLAPMAVLPEWQNKGLGSKLVDEGILACRRFGVDIIVVLGHPGYYPRFGFEPATEYGIKSEYDVPPEAFMVLELTSGALDKASGTIQYHSAFSEA